MAKFAWKVALEVDGQTALFLDGQSKICNSLYNKLVERMYDLLAQYAASGKADKEAARTIFTKRGPRDLVVKIKADHAFMYSVYSSPLKNAGLRLSRAIKAYQDYKKGKRSQKVGWPGYRKWKRKWFSLEYDEPWKGYRLSEDKTLNLSFGTDEDDKRLGVTTTLKEPLPYDHGQVKALRIVKEQKHFFAVFTIDKALPKEPVAPRKTIYIDPNHKNQGVGIDLEGKASHIDNMPNLKSLDRRIDELKSKRDGCKRKAKLITFTRQDGSTHKHWEPSRHYKSYDRALQKLYRLRRDQTKQYLFTLANALYAEYDLVTIGNYTPHGGGINRGMRRSMNNQSLIGRLKKTLAWVAERENKLFVEVSEYRTTRTCHECGYLVEGGLNPSIREWTCPNKDCLAHHDRDENSARNGLRRVLESICFVPGSGHCERHRLIIPILSRCTWRVTSRGVEKHFRGCGGSLPPSVEAAAAR